MESEMDLIEMTNKKRKADEPLTPPKSKRIHHTRITELSETNSSCAEDLDLLGKELVLKHDYIHINEMIYCQLDQCLKALEIRLEHDPGNVSLGAWIDDLTEQLGELRLYLSIQRDEVWELERLYREAYQALESF